jgi:hypothetical protein
MNPFLKSPENGPEIEISFVLSHIEQVRPICGILGDDEDGIRLGDIVVSRPTATFEGELCSSISRGALAYIPI